MTLGDFPDLCAAEGDGRQVSKGLSWDVWGQDGMLRAEPLRGACMCPAASQGSSRTSREVGVTATKLERSSRLAAVEQTALAGIQRLACLSQAESCPESFGLLPWLEVTGGVGGRAGPAWCGSRQLG